jgi:hypothetical protein
MKKIDLKNKVLLKIVVFTVITLVCLWLLPVGLISAEGAVIPVITLIGDSTVTVDVGTAYEDAGATASVVVVNVDLSESTIDLTSFITTVIQILLALIQLPITSVTVLEMTPLKLQEL